MLFHGIIFSLLLRKIAANNMPTCCC